jgi:DNA-binding protein HU-beta
MSRHIPFQHWDCASTFGHDTVLFISKTILMNKSELVDAIASGAGLSKADAARALDATTGAIHGALKSGDRVSLVGFGSFSVSKRAARTGRNPQTGAEIQIAAKNVVKFKAGAGLTV